MTCLECLQNFDNEASLHKHLKAHSLSVAFYYQKYFKRVDLLTGELIKFKTKDFYFSNEFNSRANLKRWLEQSSPEAQKEYIIRYLTNRKEKKGLIYTPTQAELKTLMVPGINYISQLFGDYYEFAKSLGFQNKFKNYKLEGDLRLHHNKKIIIDTREQNALKINVNHEIDTLKFGDYKLKHNDGGLIIERKALNDFYSTLGFQRERFEREIQRSDKEGYYMIVLIEAPLSDVYKFPLLPYIKNRMKLGAEVVLHNMRDLCQKYINLQFLFVKNRIEAQSIIETLFAAGEKCRTVDIQYLYDKGELI